MKKLCVNAALGLVIFIAVAFSLVAQDICREKVATSEGPVLGAKAAKYAGMRIQRHPLCRGDEVEGACQSSQSLECF